MQSKYFFRIGLSLALIAVVPFQAHAQFGGIGKAIKKKAVDAVLGKEGKDTAKTADSSPSSNESSSSPSARTPIRIAITSDVIDKFLVGLSAEQSKRSVVVKRNACVRAAQGTTEFMNVMAASGPELEKISNSNMSDDKKMAEMQRISAGMKARQDSFETKKCGPEVETMTDVQYEGIGAEAAGFTQPQYGMLKERIAPYCQAIAKGASAPADARLAYTDDEMQAIKPKCAALLVAIKKTT